MDWPHSCDSGHNLLKNILFYCFSTIFSLALHLYISIALSLYLYMYLILALFAEILTYLS